MQHARILVLTALGLAAAGPALAQMPPPPAPMPKRVFHRLQNQPDLLRALTAPQPQPLAPAAPPPAGSPWQSLTNHAPFNPGAMFLMTDGTVLVQDLGTCNCGSTGWWKFAPDQSGSYLNGTWSASASLPAGYAPNYYASGVLPDGRMIIEGGEYNNGALVWTNQGAIYDPVADSWKSVAPPTGSSWSRIGDAPSAVLANGVFTMGASGYQGITAQVLLNAIKLTWAATGAGKVDGAAEEGWSLLPNGDLLTADLGVAQGSEIYSPATGHWASAGIVPTELVAGDEVGPQLLQPDGSVFAAGATGTNALYNPATGLWSTAPSFPVIGGAQYDVADGPAAILPDGSVLLMASAGIYQTPSHFFIFKNGVLSQTTDAPNAAFLSSYYGLMLVLPTGQVMFNSRFGDIELFTSPYPAKAAFQPVVTSVPLTLAAGGQYTLSGKQLSGLTQAAAYGDDYQPATNYPLVRIVNTATGHVFYARTTGHTKVGVKAGAASSTLFTLPATIETGASTLYAVANGIASKPVAVTVTAAASE